LLAQQQGCCLRAEFFSSHVVSTCDERGRAAPLCHLNRNSQPNNVVLVPTNMASWPKSSHILALPNLVLYCWPSENGCQSEGVALCVQTDQQTP
jgi:hypothetical protein